MSPRVLSNVLPRQTEETISQAEPRLSSDNLEETLSRFICKTRDLKKWKRQRADFMINMGYPS